MTTPLPSPTKLTPACKEDCLPSRHHDQATCPAPESSFWNGDQLGVWLRVCGASRRLGLSTIADSDLSQWRLPLSKADQFESRVFTKIDSGYPKNGGYSLAILSSNLIELLAKLLDCFSWSNQSNINHSSTRQHLSVSSPVASFSNFEYDWWNLNLVTSSTVCRLGVSAYYSIPRVREIQVINETSRGLVLHPSPGQRQLLNSESLLYNSILSFFLFWFSTLFLGCWNPKQSLVCVALSSLLTQGWGKLRKEISSCPVILWLFLTHETVLDLCLPM